jgi:hypothetical protein
MAGGVGKLLVNRGEEGIALNDSDRLTKADAFNQFDPKRRLTLGVYQKLETAKMRKDKIGRTGGTMRQDESDVGKRVKQACA